jgi:membrane-associated protease RseP (regulator of RpoE activity)
MIRDRLTAALPDQIKVGYGTLYIHTNRGIEYIDAFASLPYIDRLSDVGVATFIFSMFASLAVLVVTGLSTLQSPPEPTAAQDPVNLLAIPGLNDFLPVAATAYIVIALVIATGVHELAHGITMRSADVTVEEVGIVTLLVVPIAAYVMPDEEEYENASVHSRARILSAGVFANLLVFAVTSFLFLLPGSGSAIEAFLAYFGSVYGGGAPAAEAVASLGVVTNVLFWTWFFNLNLAFVNALPVMTLDGGRVAGLLGELVPTPFSTSVTATAIMGVTTIGTAGVFVIAVFGPLFL